MKRGPTRKTILISCLSFTLLGGCLTGHQPAEQSTDRYDTSNHESHKRECRGPPDDGLRIVLLRDDLNSVCATIEDFQAETEIYAECFDPDQANSEILVDTDPIFTESGGYSVTITLDSDSAHTFYRHYQDECDAWEVLIDEDEVTNAQIGYD